MVIDWDRFKSEYWKPQQAVGYNIVLTNWRQERREYEGEEKHVLAFEVLKVDNKEFTPGTKTFVTGASSFAEQIEPIVKKAEANNKVGIEIYLEYGKDNRYRIADLTTVRGVMS